jgi:nitrite reductase/ring-hydroxylating ferredoxin subunit
VESELSEDFVKVAETMDIQSSSMKAYDLAGEKVCIVNVEGNYYAVGPLNEGTLEGYNVECP